jgi:hypothetical protein
VRIQTCEDTKAKPFEKSEQLFQSIATDLQAKTAVAMNHADLERHIGERSRDLMKQLLQDHLDYRGIGEATGPVIGNGGVRRTFPQERKRGLATGFGDVVITRLGYSAHGEESLFPRDSELNLPTDLYSYPLQRMAVDEIIKGSFEQAMDSVLSRTGTRIPKRQIEGIAAHAAVDFDSFYEENAGTGAQHSRPTGPILVMSTDGKGIVMREGSLRAKTREAAAGATHKMAKRLSRGEKDNRKRMAQVAAVYTIAPFERTAEDVVKDYRGGQSDEMPREKTLRPRPENKRVWASVAKEPGEVIEDMFQDALRRDPEHAKRWVVLVDGNATQIALVRKTARQHGVQVTIIMDVIHVLEYLWSAGNALHGGENRTTERWVNDHLLEILRGRSSSVAAGMRRSATLRKMKATERKAIDACAKYLLNHREYLLYDHYLAGGYPIATGVIEGACRYLVKDRMDITGARWGLETAEAVLKLRALRASGDLDAYWSFHERAEYFRNHLDQYQGTPPATHLPVKTRSAKFMRLVN